MKKLILGLMILSLETTACAEKRYATLTPPPPSPLSLPAPQEQAKEQKETIECELKFASGLCLEYVWEKKPTNEEETGSFFIHTFRIDLIDGKKIAEDTLLPLHVVLFMPSMGHGSYPPVVVTRTDLGHYRADPVHFIMTGDWEIRFQLKDGNAVKDQIIDPITI